MCLLTPSSNNLTIPNVIIINVIITGDSLVTIFLSFLLAYALTGFFYVKRDLDKTNEARPYYVDNPTLKDLVFVGGLWFFRPFTKNGKLTNRDIVFGLATLCFFLVAHTTVIYFCFSLPEYFFPDVIPHYISTFILIAVWFFIILPLISIPFKVKKGDFVRNEKSRGFPKAPLSAHLKTQFALIPKDQAFKEAHWDKGMNIPNRTYWENIPKKALASAMEIKMINELKDKFGEYNIVHLSREMSDEMLLLQEEPYFRDIDQAQTEWDKFRAQHNEKDVLNNFWLELFQRLQKTVKIMISPLTKQKNQVDNPKPPETYAGWEDLLDRAPKDLDWDTFRVIKNGIVTYTPYMTTEERLSALRKARKMDGPYVPPKS